MFSLVVLALIASQASAQILNLGPNTVNTKCSTALLDGCVVGYKCDYIASQFVAAAGSVPFDRNAGEGICKGATNAACSTSNDCQNGFVCQSSVLGPVCMSPGDNQGGNNGCDIYNSNSCGTGLYCSTFEGCNASGNGGTDENTRVLVATTCCKAQVSTGCNIPTDCGGSDRKCTSTYKTIQEYYAGGGQSGVCECANEGESYCSFTKKCSKFCSTYVLDPKLPPIGRKARRSIDQQVLAQDLFSRVNCPPGLTACPIPGASGFECIDSASELESCGGCSTSNPFNPQNSTGINCLALPGAGAVACSAGRCEVYSCKTGFRLLVAADGSSSCVEKKQRRNVLKLGAIAHS